MKTLAALLAVAACAVSLPVSAAQISSLSYDMRNGQGQASGGSANYWDLGYSGSGATNVDGAPLSGGSGDLTNGVAASGLWFNVENAGGGGPYVGWYTQVVPNPTITFAFAGTPTIDTIRIHVDNSLTGGVAQPGSYLVNGNAWGFTPLADNTFGWVTLTGAPVSGNSLSLQLIHSNRGAWVFASEVEFYGTSGTVIPLPAAAWLMLGGLGLMGALGRRARKAD